MISEFTWKVRIYYEDTDAGGVVFYANYLRFMERARTEWLRSIGFEHETLINEHGVLFAVRSVTIDYKKSARLDDLISITSQLISNRGASINFRQLIKNETDELLAQAEVKVACLNAITMKASPMPKELLLELSNDH
ncbi:MAG TPA: tol-pal system-associated acyl-CoA thioesterase [Thiotrichaceae bacterium]|jgi:acyl-CoA thioester hydrolase|nr:tol-pal system-associated acyl-CoA thioesterase [Thiotrichaceae bacterium]HIM07571.1 tol-pal system-associated acyl-CoA thioesterase [Gammaproteobacteria bacterium]